MTFQFIEWSILQFRDTFSFMIIMTVIMMCYNISYYALLYPNSEFSWEQMEKIIRNGYWMLFGELNLDGDTCKQIVIQMYKYRLKQNFSIELFVKD